eukprot:3051147-Alexandrium_andersonii.AAC.1
MLSFKRAWQGHLPLHGSVPEWVRTQEGCWSYSQATHCKHSLCPDTVRPSAPLALQAPGRYNGSGRGRSAIVIVNTERRLPIHRRSAPLSNSEARNVGRTRGAPWSGIGGTPAAEAATQL